MRPAAAGFAIGVWLLQQQAVLPGFQWIGAGLAPACALLVGAWVAKRPALNAACCLAAFIVFGFCWAALLAHMRLADRLDPEIEGRDIVVSGVIAGLPQTVDHGVRFDFDVELPETGVPRHVFLSWYRGDSADSEKQVPALRAGERWRFTVRLRRPHGNVNPHGFDYEAWLLERDTRATGYVRLPPRAAREGDARAHPRRLMPLVQQPRYWIARLREAVREKIRNVLAGRPFAGVLIALAIGDQRAIGPGEWQLFARTGVSHLMSISGLHVTMVAGLFAALVSCFWRRSEVLALAVPAQKAAVLAGFLAAFAYCLISGFAVPAQRTLYMVGVVAAALWLGLGTSTSRVLAAALLAVLLLDPWAVLSPGFWLSFAAVALIFHIASGDVERPHWLVQWGRVQWAVTVGLAPLLLVLFQQVSIVSPIANAAAIPLVSFVITPLALVGAVFPFDWPLMLGHAILEVLMTILRWLSAFPRGVWQQHAPMAWTVPFALVGVVWLLLPRGFPARGLGALLMLPMFAVKPAGPAAGDLWVTVLDVGQGLAVLVRTEKHALLFDAGPAFSADSDSGSRVILPYLRSLGVDSLDALVISHDDRDHSGGAASVLQALPVGVLWSSLASDHPLLAAPTWRLPCSAGRGWSWDGVVFEFLHPGVARSGARSTSSNNRSCVLRIAGSGGGILLTGDIERAAERELLARSFQSLPTEALLVPHHGSATSSSPEFVERVAPREAIIAVGYRNRFGHPRENVLDRYRRIGSRVLRTDEGGAIGLRFAAGGVTAETERTQVRRYWRE